MEERPVWAPLGIDLNRPSAARVYNHWLGGGHNFAADRALADRVGPGARQSAIANRKFLRRAVRFLVNSGVRQYLDLGSGIPTAGNVHEIAQSIEPAARVVYVDTDPVAIGHSRAVLAQNLRSDAVLGDIRKLESVLADTRVQRLIDFTEPVAVLMLAVLHLIPDADAPAAIIGKLLQIVPAGSYVALSHPVTPAADPVPAPLSAAVTAYNSRVSTPVTLRRPEEIVNFFAGWELVESGVTAASAWRPDAEVGSPAEQGFAVNAGVARKAA